MYRDQNSQPKRPNLTPLEFRITANFQVSENLKLLPGNYLFMNISPLLRIFISSYIWVQVLQWDPSNVHSTPHRNSEKGNKKSIYYMVLFSTLLFNLSTTVCHCTVFQLGLSAEQKI